MPEKNRKSHPEIDQKANATVAVIIVAAGTGKRAGGDLPKQYQNLAGKPVLARTIERFLEHFETNQIHVVIHDDYREEYEQACSQYDLPAPISGGKTRQESVQRGLQSLEALRPEHVLIHDAARPFVSNAIIGRVLTELQRGSLGVVPALPVIDTLKHVTDATIDHTVDRSSLYAVQTPQGFSYSTLLKAHRELGGQEHTDDASLLEALGHKVTICDGEETNFKITRPEDFQKAEQTIMSALSDIRVGSGFDVHRFEAGDSVTLCGIDIPFGQKLKGHSDADVAMHAITDAILGALCDGDIGTHFPPNEPQWKGEPSKTFLSFAAKRVLEHRGAIAHVGVTIICEAPKIGPHKDKMRQKISEIMDICGSKVSVQATTTEKLGFTGRGEGIAAQATATIRLPMDLST
jgi:2-C-methyl-D-erythritol 4-phosphate cytidylyltransferase/2-C-methyl-D-erythritol 2,4-cyclodiphosphate synthase